MEEKLKAKINKLHKLAQQGVDGEKIVAQQMLEKLMEKHGISSFEDLNSEEIEYCLFSYNGQLEFTLLKQCMYKVMGNNNELNFYKTKNTRQKLGIYCTKTQRLEIELDFAFYKNCFYEEAKLFLNAFISKQDIFPEDIEIKCIENYTDEDFKIIQMLGAIDKKTRFKALE